MLELDSADAERMYTQTEKRRKVGGEIHVIKTVK